MLNSFDWLNPFEWLATVILLFKVFAFVDAATRREDAYRAADKKTKGFWLIILGLALALDLIFGVNPLGSFLTLAGLVAAIVYIVDVRPAIRALTGGRGGPADRLGRALRSRGRKGGGRW
ncbi:DUF2516 family protein [Kitasatospora acidiphila]|uniref:DUF2516 family protein n=1 Tax=Kitasatospora acidiphila TaxID=2567942 RepID=A0A540WF56_9ACTN|nr:MULTISPECIES: DUF2516 family protein [Kitasatospora]TQF07537.1 DUF2516 family protein [Kitasatospora acidiphila]